MALTQQAIKSIHADLRIALEEVAKKHSITLAQTGIRYAADGSGFKLTSEFGDNATIGDTNPKFYSDLRKHGYKVGLKIEDLGKQFTIGVNTFKFEGMYGYTKAVGKKISGDEKLYQFSARDVAAELKRGEHNE